MSVSFKVLLFLVLIPGAVFGQPGTPLSLLSDDPVAARLDEMAAQPWIANSPLSADTVALNVHGFPPAYIPAWPEAIYQERLVALDAQTPFNLVYNNTVQSYIDLYAVRKREMTSRMLGLADLYFPVFEEYLDKYEMPLEMKYLAVVESALNPAARSRAGAVGLWQFMLPTGKMFGLKSTSYVDERHDLFKSTEAACKYLTYLHGLYDNWEMALAAYNCGPGNVNKAIRRSGGQKDYWKIYDHLPRETRGYVPAFIAVNYIFAHAADHNIYPAIPMYCAHQVDTLQVCYPLDLASIAAFTGSSVEEVRNLNPTFKLGVVPDLEESVTIYLPKQMAGIYVTNEDSLKYVALQASAGSGTPTEETVEARTETTPKYHTVKRGESLGLIAQKYHTSVSQLQRLNGIRGTMIHTGDRLKVGETAKPVVAKAVPASSEFIYYEVQPGDTLNTIAEQLPGVTVDDLRRLNADLKNEELEPGRKIKVGTQKG